MCTEREIPADRTDIETGATTAAAAAAVPPGPGVTESPPPTQPRLASWARYTQRFRYWLVGSKREAKVAPAEIELHRSSTAPASPARAAAVLYPDPLETAQQEEDVTPSSAKVPTNCLGRLLLMYSGE